MLTAHVLKPRLPISRRIASVPILPSRFDLLVTRYIDHIRLIDNLAPTTCENRRSLLKAFAKTLDNQSVYSITLQDIDSYLMARRETVQASTTNQDKQALRSFFEYCQTRLMLELPFDYTMIKRSRERPVKVISFAPHEIGAVITRCTEEIDGLMIAVLFETGMRIGELANLRVEDLRDTEIMIRGKGERERVVMMTPLLAGSLRNHLIARNISRGHVFQPIQYHYNHNNYKYASDTIRQRIQRQFKLCGIKMHPHQLRHSFALNWLTNGGNIRSLQKLLGHENLDTTQRYLNLTDSHLSDEYRRYFVNSVYKPQRGSIDKALIN